MSIPAQDYLQQFVNRPDVYAEQWVGKDKHGYKPIWRPLTLDDFEQHLFGLVTLGMYSTSEDLTCRWVCWDIDVKDEEKTNILIGWLTQNSLFAIRESVKFEKSGHVWLFFDKPIPSAKCLILGQYAKFYAGLDCEFFPKQANVTKKGPGNLVRLPLGKNQKPEAYGAVGLFYDCPDEDLVAQLFWFLEQRTNTSELVLTLIDTLPKPKAPKQLNKVLKGPKIPILEKFPLGWAMREQENGEVIAKCPVCHLEGFDRQCNNLSINIAENVLYCHRNNGEHTYTQIMRALRQIKQKCYIIA